MYVMNFFKKWPVVIFVGILNCWIFVNEIILRYSFLDNASVLSDSVDGYVRLLLYRVVLDNLRRHFIKWCSQLKRNKADNIILMFCMNDNDELNILYIFCLCCSSALKKRHYINVAIVQFFNTFYHFLDLFHVWHQFT